MYKEDLIQQLRDGRIAVKNDGNRQLIIDLIKYAFPNDMLASGCSSSYGLDIHNEGYWTTDHSCDEIVNATDFLLSQPNLMLIF